MNLKDLYQFIDTHRETIILPVVVILLFGTGLFFIDDIWLGWAARTTVCPPPATQCSFAESMGYVGTVTSSGIALDETYLKERTAVELGSLMEVLGSKPAMAPYIQDINTALTRVKDQITSAVAADTKVYAMLQKKIVQPQELEYVTHRIRLALLEQIQQYITDASEKESTTLEKGLADILPDEATSFSLTKLIEDRSTNYLTPGERFLLEKLQIENTRSDGNIFDTVTVNLTVQSTADALERFLADINTSGVLNTTGPTKSLPLMRLTNLSLTSIGSTSPTSSIDTPRPVYRGDIRIETYTRALTQESLKPLQQEVTSLRDKAKGLQTTGQLRPGVETQKMQQLTDLANNSERQLDAAIQKPDWHAAKDQLNTLKELYQTIIGNYTAS